MFFFFFFFPKVTKLLSASNNPALNFSRALIVLSCRAQVSVLRYCSVDRWLLCVEAARARRVLFAVRAVLSMLGSERFGGKQELDCRNENKPLTSCCFHSWSGEAVSKLLLGEGPSGSLMIDLVSDPLELWALHFSELLHAFGRRASTVGVLLC